MKRRFRKTTFYRIGGRVLLLSGVLIFCAVGRAEEPLYEQDPYDVVTIKESGEEQVLKVLPLKLPGRKIPKNLRSRAKFQVRLYDSPETLYEISWSAVVRIKFFEQRILDKAKALIAAKKYEEAYDYLKFLQGRHPDTQGLSKAWEESLYEEAKTTHRRGEYDAALALLRELHARNPQWPGLDRALGLTTDKLIAQYTARRRYATARTLLRALQDAYPRHSVVVVWRERFHKEAEKFFRVAQAAARAGDWSAAVQEYRKSADIWPDLPGAKELAEAIHRKYPRVEVGVMTPWSPGATNRLADEGLRRVARLCYRTLTEYLGPGTEGGQYRCPLGAFRREGLGRKLIVQLQPNLSYAEGDAAVTGYDLAQRLRELTRPGDPGYHAAWAELLSSVAVRGVYTVEAKLCRPYVRPEALLQILVVPHGAGDPTFFIAPANGPFRLPAPPESPKTQDSPKAPKPKITFLANPRYFAAKPGQPQELVERHYALGSHAIRDLKGGVVQALDRIAPWNIPQVQSAENLAVGRYAVPRVHCLIPNLRRPLTAKRIFRRALVYGINRKVILSQLLGDREIDGCRVISGPFPAGAGIDDPLSYAYDERITPRPYDPRLALALAGAAALDLEAETRKSGKIAKKTGGKKAETTAAAAKKPKLPGMKSLVLSYPDEEVARAACTSIQKQLAVLGLQIELRPLSGPVPRRIPDDVDLLYAALAIQEPVVDAGALFDDAGLTGGCSPYLRLALAQLDQATDWAQARNRLHRIHRLVHEEVAILPLWQLVEFFAYRRDLLGIGRRPVTLYENIEQWQVPFHYPVGEE